MWSGALCSTIPVASGHSLVARTATAAAAAEPATAAATATAVLTRFRLVDGEAAALDFSAVEFRDGGFAFSFRPHLHKPKAARTACITVRNYRDRFDCADLRKEALQIVVGCLERE